MEELKKTVCSEVDAWRDRLVATSRKINAHPELGFEEVKASKWLVELLAEAGFNVRLGEAGMDTAFWAEYRGPGSGKTVTFLAEYDALPEIGHACGHNIIGTSNVGAGKRCGWQLGWVGLPGCRPSGVSVPGASSTCCG